MKTGIHKIKQKGGVIKLKTIRDSELLRENYPVKNHGLSKRKPLYGVGINDADYAINPVICGVNVMCPSYAAWVNMLTRAYSSSYHKRQPTYRDVIVCDEWLTFSNFRKWWINNYIENYQLDKDLLFIGNKIYSPEACIYVPRWLNNFILDRKSSRGEYKVGVYKHKKNNNFIARCRNPKSKGGVEYLGVFDNDIKAHNAWLTRKLQIATELKPEMDSINIKIYPNIVEIIKNMK